jgi:tripartite-type tricarboxylate transporter receptor subunit TctC
MQNLSYKTPDDYTAVIGLISVHPMLAVKPDSPWKTFAEFLGAAKASPGKIRVGTPGAGSLHHMNLIKLEKLTGAQFTMVPFAGFGEMGPALLGGHVESLIALPGEVKPHVDAGKMRLLGMFQPARNSFFPDLPTFKEMGYDVAYNTTFCLAAAKATPAAAARYLHDTMKSAIEEPSFTAFLKARALEADYSGGDRLKAVLWDDYREHTAVLGALGLLKK